jgi:hypothetical protein
MWVDESIGGVVNVEVGVESVVGTASPVVLLERRRGP